ncbi:uncharacterized protein [Halyomorpha halys]|uniref:uncharacterized protein n=1 Tax=Halyomorpha halys TaxID=286706 RepID=UPI0006D516BB|nr:uncharacterized protein LOC106680491 [Halyomorpha halys]
MEKLSFLLIVLSIYYVKGDTISLDVIKKAIESLGSMLINIPPTEENSLDRKSVFQLYTCLSLTKDLELLLLNHTEVFILDPKQTCCCRTDTDGQVENISFAQNLTLNTDLFIHSLVNDLINNVPTEKVTESSTTTSDESQGFCEGSTGDSCTPIIDKDEIQLTDTENAAQIVTRFIIKRWALTSLKDDYPPVFELYTCLSLLKETEQHLGKNLNLLKKLSIKEGEKYAPCKCNPSLDVSCKLFIDSKLMATHYEMMIYEAIKQLPVMPEIFWNNLNYSLVK